MSDENIIVQLTKKNPDSKIDKIYPITKASAVKFNDNTSLQDKYDAGEIGGGSSSETGEQTSQSYWRPQISQEGEISWNLSNSIAKPTPVSVKGPQGEAGPAGITGDTGEKGDIFFPNVDSDGNLSWEKKSWNDQTIPTTTNIKGPKGDTTTAEGKNNITITDKNTELVAGTKNNIWIQYMN